MKLRARATGRAKLQITLSSAESAYNGLASVRTGPRSNGLRWPGLMNHDFLCIFSYLMISKRLVQKAVQVVYLWVVYNNNTSKIMSIDETSVSISAVANVSQCTYKWPRIFFFSPGLAMVLTAAFEFDPRSNKEATIRPTDNIEVPQVVLNINTVLHMRISLDVEGVVVCSFVFRCVRDWSTWM